MSAALLLRLAWPDVLERVRRSSFLLTVGATIWLASLVYTNNIQMSAGGYRGVVNSAWLGTIMALAVTTLVSLVGFYVVKNAVERDRQTGVGQILAATRVSTPAYLLAKWVSNFAVLATIVVTLAVAAVALHYLKAEDVRLDLVALLAPLLLLALPAMALAAAAAILFETVPWLSGGAGNVVYFFAWNAALVTPLVTRARWADWSGITLVESSLAAAVHAHAPGAPASMSFSVGPAEGLARLAVIDWAGIEWTPSAIGLRAAWFAVSVFAVIAASVWFDRFDTVSAGARPRTKPAVAAKRASPRRLPGFSRKLFTAVWNLLDRLISARTRLGAMVVAELRLTLSEASGWWAPVAAGLWVATLVSPMPVARFLHVVTWLWPLLLWSRMGVRETLYRTGPLVYSCPRPLSRQFTALWLSGVLIAAVTGSGIALRFVLAGDATSLSAWIAGAAFVPSLALALGVWSGSSRTFEAFYTAWWYVGPANRVTLLDYSSAWASASPMPTALVYGLLAAALLAVAAAGRRRLIQG